MKLKDVIRKLLNWLDIWEETLWVYLHPRVRKGLFKAIEEIRK